MPNTTAVPTITLEMHQRTALDHVRDTETFTLVAYADNRMYLDKPSEDVTLVANVEVDRPYLYAGSVEEWRGEVARAAIRKAWAMRLPGVWMSTEGEICADYKSK